MWGGIREDMYIDPDLCKRCLDCRPVCPVGAIVVREKQVVIDYESCVECGVCQRFGICEEGAIKQVDEIPYPRVLRAVFSDVTAVHKVTGIGGRGTEEMKTNDVTGMFGPGEMGFSVELGRPGIGAYFTELEKVVRKVTEFGVEFAPDNPVYPLIADFKTGALLPEILGEKVLSAIVEFKVPTEQGFEVIDKLTDFMNAELETVASMSVIVRADQEGNTELIGRLKARGYKPYPNGKVNIGMALV